MISRLNPGEDQLLRRQPQGSLICFRMAVQNRSLPEGVCKTINSDQFFQPERLILATHQVLTAQGTS
ncbi:MAG: hypothetical protein WBX03_09880 [Terriglobales bacterium]